MLFKFKNKIINYLKKKGFKKKNVIFIEKPDNNKKKFVNYVSELKIIIDNLYRNILDFDKIVEIPIYYFNKIAINGNNDTFIHLLLKYNYNDENIPNVIKVIDYLNNNNIDWDILNKNNEIPLFISNNFLLVKHILENKKISIYSKYSKYNLYHKLLLTNNNNRIIVNLIKNINISNILKKEYINLISNYKINLNNIVYSNKNLFKKYNINNKILKAYVDNIYEYILNDKYNKLNNFLFNFKYNDVNDTVYLLNKYRNSNQSLYNPLLPSKSWLYKCIIYIYNLPILDYVLLYNYTVDPSINIYIDKYRFTFNINQKTYILTKHEIMEIYRNIFQNIPKLDKTIELYRGISNKNDLFTSITSLSLSNNIASKFSNNILIKMTFYKNSSLIPIFLLSKYINEFECITLPIPVRKLREINTIALDNIIDIDIKNYICNENNLYKYIKYDNYIIYCLNNKYKKIYLSNPLNYIIYDTKIIDEYKKNKQNQKIYIEKCIDYIRKKDIKNNIELDRLIKEYIKNNNIKIII